MWDAVEWESVVCRKQQKFVILDALYPKTQWVRDNNVVSEQHNASIQGQSTSKGYVSKSVVWGSATVRLEAVLEPVMNATLHLMR